MVEKTSTVVTQFTSVIVTLLCLSCLFSQEPVTINPSIAKYTYPNMLKLDTTLKSAYPFINLEKNNFKFYSEKSENWTGLYLKISKMIVKKENKLNFYHIGGSHLQADIYTHDFRTFLQSYWSNLPGERGLVFPFELAKTNNPSNYDFSSPNNWKAYRSVSDRSSTLDYGLMGAVIVCSDSVITITFKHNKTNVKPPFTQLRIYHNKGRLPFDLNFGESEILIDNIISNPEKGYTDIYFNDPIHEMDIQFTRNTQDALELELYGFLFMNDNPGISYNTIGVNGASLSTYLKNNNYEEQLASYPPDLFVFSVGTNDANVPYNQFNPELYKTNLEKLILKVLHTNPSCALLLTVPNDSYYYKKYPNQNIAREREVIIELAKKYEAAVWDFYGIMGELGSSKLWQQNHLMQNDLVHFTATGYHLKGDLLIDAFLKFMDQFDKLNVTH
jgi:lysophospholipase L1-like esterase